MDLSQRRAVIEPVCAALIEALGLDPRDYEAIAMAIRACGGRISDGRVRLVITGKQPGNVVRADLAKLACLRWAREAEEGDRQKAHTKWAHLVQSVLGVPAIAEVWRAAAQAEVGSPWHRVADELRTWVEVMHSGVLLPNP